MKPVISLSNMVSDPGLYDSAMVYASDNPQVFPGTQIFSGLIGDEIEDSFVTGTYGVRHYTVVFVKDTVQTASIQFSVPWRDDWGPFTDAMIDNLKVMGTLVTSGTAQLGTLKENSGISLPTQAQLTDAKMASMITAAGLSDVSPGTGNTSRDMQFFTVLHGGRIIRIAKNSQASFANGNLVGSWVGQRLQTFYKFLETNPEEAIVTVGGYKWRIRVMSDAMFLSLGDSIANSVPSTKAVQANFGFPNFAGRYLVGSTVQGDTNCMWTVNYITPAVSTMSNQVNSGGVNLMFLYYEYVGPA